MEHGRDDAEAPEVQTSGAFPWTENEDGPDCKHCADKAPCDNCLTKEARKGNVIHESVVRYEDTVWRAEPWVPRA